MPRPRWPNCRRPRRSLRSMARRRTPSLTSAARPTCARGWNGCCSLRQNIRAGSISPASCAESSGGSPARSLSRCLRSFLFWTRLYGAKALERMHLRPPAFVRFLGGNPYPRITVTHRPSQREADWAYGPFPSRAAAERYSEEALKLFLLRRCTFDLAPDPAIPAASTPK